MSETQMTSKNFIDLVKMSPALIPLLIKAGISLYRLNRDAKKAGKVFESELVKAGMDEEMASVMKEEYLESSRFLNMAFHSFKKNVKDS
ncbi:MAG TPA: hypothetical protein PK718_06760 [Candidatus Methanofastidiosa archaeon]|nr:hypothetical protein [Candidatus Methanofastidiosa archaeon]